jgi:DNA-binding XRE family transcriptional regulator
VVKDFLDEMIEQESARDPGFPAQVEAALNRRELARELAAERRAAGKTQIEMAAALGTSQSQVARIESGNGDAKLSTLARFAAVLGKTIEFQVKDIATKPARRAASKPRSRTGATATRSR